MHIRHRLLLQLFPAEGNETPRLDVTFSTNGLWMQYFTKNWAHNRFVENIVPQWKKYCLLFSIILKVLSGWEVIRTQGKCIKSYKNFWKYFVVQQNLTHPKGNFWSYVYHPYEIVVLWDDRAIGNMDPWLKTFRAPISRCKFSIRSNFHNFPRIIM